MLSWPLVWVWLMIPEAISGNIVIDSAADHHVEPAAN